MCKFAEVDNDIYRSISCHDFHIDYCMANGIA